MKYVINHIRGLNEIENFEECQKIVIQPVREDELIVNVFDEKKPRDKRLVSTFINVESIFVALE